MNPKSLLLTILLFALSLPSALGAEELRGRVADSQGKPLAGAIVKLMDGEDIAAYCSTNSEGRYALRIPDDTPAEAMVEVGMFGFEPFSALLEQMRKKPDVVLHETASALQ